MSTQKNVEVPAGEWVDVYAKSGITVGTQVEFQVIKSSYRYPVLMSVASSTPDGSNFNAYDLYEWGRNDSGDVGLWAYSENTAVINVRTLL